MDNSELLREIDETLSSGRTRVLSRDFLVRCRAALSAQSEHEQPQSIGDAVETDEQIIRQLELSPRTTHRRAAKLLRAAHPVASAQVPREPTPAMLKAATHVYIRIQQQRIPKWSPDIAADFWTAMYDAAIDRAIAGERA